MPKDVTLSRCLKPLEAEYGGIRTFTAERPLDQLAVIILASGSTQKRAEQALKRLKESFVDWNEIRVSTAREVVDAVQPSADRDLRAKATFILDVLRLIYAKYNELSLTFLLPDAGDGATRKRDRLLNLLSQQSPAIAAVLKVYVGDRTSIELSGNGVGRVLARLGIVKKQPGVCDIKDAITKGLDANDRILAIFGLHRLAEEVCHPRKPECGACAFTEFCPSAEARSEGGAAAAAAGARERGGKGGGLRRPAGGSGKSYVAGK